MQVAQCLQAVLLPFSINSPTFQYFAYIFSVFQYFTKSSIYDVCTAFPQFSVFLKFYQYLWSEFSKNTDESVYLEALVATHAVCQGSIPKFYVCKIFSKLLSKIQLFTCKYKYSNVFGQLLSIPKKIAKAVYLLASFQNIKIFVRNSR